MGQSVPYETVLRDGKDHIYRIFNVSPRVGKRWQGTRVKSKYGSKEGSKQTSNVILYNIQYQRQHKNNHAVYARVL